MGERTTRSPILRATCLRATRAGSARGATPGTRLVARRSTLTTVLAPLGVPLPLLQEPQQSRCQLVRKPGRQRVGKLLGQYLDEKHAFEPREAACRRAPFGPRGVASELGEQVIEPGVEALVKSLHDLPAI
jgi:hypothetical protein